MSDSADVGSILGYLRLDRSDWDAELNAAGRKADELARHSPNIKISTNAPTAIAQLAAVAAAVKRLQDAQGAEGVAQSKLADLQAKGNVSAGKLAQAQERVEKAHRATSAATLALAAAYDKNDQAVLKAAADTDSLAKSADKTTTSFKVGLIPALLALAPAAVPIAGVAGGALAGLIPVVATLGLGIKGIENDMKSGALAGTKYGADINSITGEFSRLQTIAAGGLLAGLDKGLASSHGLFGEINRDVGVMSGQLGAIVAGAAPALLKILTELNPLFVTFGHALVDGAQHLEHWAESSNGVQHFVAYVQAELPEVLHFLGETVVLFEHLAQGAAPFGGVLLHDITMFIGVLNDIPIGVLQTAIPLAVALYAAFKTYGLATTAVKGTERAVASLGNTLGVTGPKAEAFAAKQLAATLQVEAAEKESARVAAQAEAQKAADTATAAEARAASLRGVQSALATEVEAEAASAREWAVAEQAKAAAAERAAAKIAASADAAATASAEANAAASVGIAGVLGPITALAVGGGLLATMFLHSGKAAQEAAAQINTYTEAIKADSGVLGENTRLAAVKALNDAGALTAADKLGISVKTVTDAVLGNSDAQAQLTKRLAAWRDEADKGNAVVATQYIGSVKKLSKAVNDQTNDVHKSVQSYKDQQAAMGESTTVTNAHTVAIDAQAPAAAALFGLTGTKGVAAYLAAKQAAQQNTQQTQQQTLQYQLANDAASLLAQTLDKLSGKNLGYAQAQNSFDSALSNMGTHVNATGKQITFTTTSIRNMSSASVELRGQLLGQVTSAEQAAESYGKLKGSSEAGRQKLIELRREIINNAVAHGVDRQAVRDYINTVLKIPAKVPPTKLDINTQQAKEKAIAYIAWLQSLPTVTIGVNFAANRQGTFNSQVPGSASGTNGRGLPRGVSAVGEQGPELAVNDGSSVQILSHLQSKAYLAASGMTAPGFAGGTISGDLSSLTSALGIGGSSSPVSAVKQAIAQLLSDAGAGSQLAGAINAEGAALLGYTRTRTDIVNELNKSEQRMKTLIQDAHSVAASVRSAVNGTFDIGTAGGGQNGQSPISARSILAQEKTAAATARRFNHGLRKLEKEGLGQSLVGQLGQEGPADLPTVLALLKANPHQLNAINHNAAELHQTGRNLGKFVAADMFGGRIDAAKDVVTELKSQKKATEKQVKEILQQLEAMANQLKVAPRLTGAEVGRHIPAPSHDSAKGPAAHRAAAYSLGAS